ncbi:MAG: dTDP-4-dehydrorhamnose reductase [Nitrosopumilus sp.]|nr:dTDP-4-dehydrorhamnose reductase [Nitrosopumilus sp.]MDH3488193.1 dTDP-4-dehydrorhamnose reductase [Nitrosopumilus sp.]
MKFLVTGSAGLIGSQVIKDLTLENHEVYSCYHNNKPICGNPLQLDLTNQDKIIKTIQEIKPDSIIHLAAMTNVDLCETQQELAHLINVKSTEILAKQAAKLDTFFVYVSTDYVFDGKKGKYSEDDSTNPLGYYGKSKLKAEKVLNKLASNWCIARTSTPFGTHSNKKSFPIWIKENLEAKKEIPVLIDQFTSPTYVPNLSKMLIEIAKRKISEIIHTAGASRISRYELAILVSEKLHLDKELLKPVQISQMNWNAQRPKDSSLDVSKAAEILNEKPQTIQHSLNLLVEEILNK